MIKKQSQRIASVALAALLLAPAGWAHGGKDEAHDHAGHAHDGEHEHTAPHGGQVVSLEGHLHVEVLFAADAINLWLSDADGKALPPPKDLSATVIVGQEVKKPVARVEGDHIVLPGPLPSEGKVVVAAQLTFNGRSRSLRVERAPLAEYTCPMHPEVVQKGPGTCPKCKMDLVKKSGDAGLSVVVTPATKTVSPGKKTRLTFEVKDAAGVRIKDLEVVHDKPFHLLMTTPDLSFYAHEHPEAQKDGTYAVDFTFPQGGTYVLFADIKAKGGPSEVVRTTLDVAGPAKAPVALAASDLQKPNVVDGYSVRLLTPPSSVGGIDLRFSISKGSTPVKNLAPYLGAMGHLVIVHEDGRTFLHSHPSDGGGSGPEISFGTRFPKAGKYKAWLQFQHDSSVKTVPFVVEIR